MPKDQTQNPGRLVDLATFVLALDLTQDIAALRPEDQKLQAHVAKGIALFQRHRADLEILIKNFLASLVESPTGGILKPTFHRIEFGSLGVRVDNIAQFLEAVFLWLKNHPTIFRDVFQSRGHRGVVLIIQALNEMGTARLAKLANIPLASGLSPARRWVTQAAAMLGVGPSEAEQTLTDAESASAVGEELTRTQEAIRTSDPMTEEAVALQDRKQELTNTIQEIASSSPAPSVVFSAAVASASNPESKVARQFGLTDEQTSVMLSSGKIVVAAAAGSGKTQTLVATIAHLVEERGYAPNQVLACSFTIAASSELAARVEKAGVHGATIGTTHSIARQIIFRNRPNLRAVVERGKDKADTIFRMAMKQVELDMGQFQETKQKIMDQMAAIEGIYGWQRNEFLNSLYSQLSRGRALSEKQEAALGKWTRGRRYASDELEASWGRTLTATQEDSIVAKEPARDPITAAWGDSGPAPEGGGRGQSPYWTTPVGEWFNIGQDIVDDAGKPMSFRTASLHVENFKNSRQSVEQVRTERGDQDPIVALYGAYEWLKRNDKVYGPAMDFTDQLIVALNILEEDPRALEREQRIYKAVFVDEAQDLNEVQFKLFNLIGQKAEVMSYIGDDKQCISTTSKVSTPKGRVEAGKLQPGDFVMSYRNGDIQPQKIRHVVPSPWTAGLRVTTESGHSLLMSPNHRLWATEPTTEEGQIAVYLMYRPDMGFRVGITNKGKSGTDDYYMSYGGRAFLEKPERLWVLEICQDREAALLQEERYSLRYSISTMVFNGEHRDGNQERINAIFEEFGRNGARLLEERHFSFEHPHWMSQSYTKHGRDRHIITLLAHAAQNSQVTLEWEGDKFDSVLQDMGVKEAPGNRRRLRRYFKNYRDALEVAELVSSRIGAPISHKLSTPEGTLREMTASSLFVGMSVPVYEGDPERGITMEPITSIKRVEGQFVDLDVEDASNFFADGILTHNSIYGFRGAKPSNYVDLSRDPNFQLKMMTMNFRSGKAIVDAGTRLIAHNEDRQIQMVCVADVERKGEGSIKAKITSTHEEAADRVAQEIKMAVDSGDSPSDFGILVRNHAEADAYTIGLLVRGIPYRMLKKSEGGYFGRPLVRALVSWIRLVAGGTDAEVNEAVVSAHATPGFGLDKAFEQNLANRVRGNYLDYISSGQPVYAANQEWRNGKSVAPYANAIREVRAVGASDSVSVIRAILALKGTKGQTFEETLINMVDEEDIFEEEAGEITEEAKKAAAMAPLRPLMIMADNFKDPANLLQFVAKMKAANEKAQKKSPQDKEDWKEPAVLIGTVHGWKGLQAKHCYVSMSGGIFPNFRTDAEAALQDKPVTAYDEERRLAYVAITRGEQSVTVLCPAKNYLGRDSSVSRFVTEACINVEGEQPGDEYADEGDTAEDALAEGLPIKTAAGDRVFIAGLISNLAGTQVLLFPSPKQEG